MGLIDYDRGSKRSKLASVVRVLIVATLLSLLAYSTHDMYTFVVSLDDFSFRRNGLNGLTRWLQLNSYD